MKPTIPNKLNAQIYDEASEWLVEFRTGEVDTPGRKKFTAWLRSSPEHMRAYLELAAIWNEGAHLDPEHRFDADQLSELAAGDNVIPLDRRPAVEAPTRERGARSGITLFAVAASVLVAIGGAWGYLERNTYSTGIGEQRSLALEDGSTVELNSDSKIRVHFSAERRTIDLIEGQALFHVAKDAARPFIVRSDDTKVRAVGTEFDVYRKMTGTTVSVVEGRVAVLDPRAEQSPKQQATVGSAKGENPSGEGPGEGPVAGAGEFLLAAGEQAIVTAQSTEKPKKPNVAAATAWTQRRLVFDSATLADVAEEFNRYNRRRLVIKSPELAEFHITGVFASTDPKSLIRFLQARPEIVVTEKSNEILITRKVE
jgi:transmembrane sensor